MCFFVQGRKGLVLSKLGFPASSALIEALVTLNDDRCPLGEVFPSLPLPKIIMR